VTARRRDLRLIVSGLGLLLAGPTAVAPLHAQASCSIVVVVPSRECFRQSDPDFHHQPLGPKTADYRYEGLAIGAGVGVLAGVLIGVAVCHEVEDPDQNCVWPGVRGALGGGLVLGLLGALIGAQFPKEETAPEDSTATAS
jgi:hypothetical protein